jgi:hypothetical protein
MASSLTLPGTPSRGILRRQNSAMGTPLRPPLAPVKVKVSRRRRKPETVSEDIKQAVIKLGECLQVEFGSAFDSNPRLKRRVAQLLASQLPPHSRRPGRPGFPEVSKADRLFENLRGKSSDNSYRASRWIWRQIYPLCIEGYNSLPAAERCAAEQELRDRVRWRRGIRYRKSGKP